MRFNMMAFAAAVSLALPALAQTTDTAAAPPKPKQERKVCRALPGMTGSNMAKTVCRTRSEWAIIDQRDLDPTSQRVRSSTDAGNIGPGVRPY